ncbi:MAG: XdhC family protein [Bacteroidales bacterium]|nr:XdhC family protein [Bacteroidales bacterium]
MRNQTREIFEWCKSKEKSVLATLIHTEGSSLYPIGTKMGIVSQSQFIGAISGGCVESDLIETAMRVLETNVSKTVQYGPVRDSLLDIGLSCGGTIKILLEPVSDAFKWEQILKPFNQEDPFFCLTQVDKTKRINKTILEPDEFPFVLHDLEKIITTQSYFSKLIKNNDTTSFLEYFPKPKKLIIIGAVPIALALIKLAKVLNFQTILIDPRKSLLMNHKFNQADLTIGKWPEEAFKDINIDSSCYLATLSHDERIDDNAIEIALDSDMKYIGALGSKATHASRSSRLILTGFSEGLIAKIHAPIGLKIGNSYPEEIALSIMAQIISLGKQ